MSLFNKHLSRGALGGLSLLMFYPITEGTSSVSMENSIVNSALSAPPADLLAFTSAHDNAYIQTKMENLVTLITYYKLLSHSLNGYNKTYQSCM